MCFIYLTGNEFFLWLLTHISVAVFPGLTLEIAPSSSPLTSMALEPLISRKISLSSVLKLQDIFSSGIHTTSLLCISLQKWRHNMPKFFPYFSEKELYILHVNTVYIYIHAHTQTHTFLFFGICLLHVSFSEGGGGWLICEMLSNWIRGKYSPSISSWNYNYSFNFEPV